MGPQQYPEWSEKHFNTDLYSQSKELNNHIFASPLSRVDAAFQIFNFISLKISSLELCPFNLDAFDNY